MADVVTDDDIPLQQPAYTTPPCVQATNAPDQMDHHDRMRLRAAAFKATRVYPGPVGQLISRELLMWEEFGWRLGGRKPIHALMHHVEHTAEPAVAPAA